MLPEAELTAAAQKLLDQDEKLVLLCKFDAKKASERYIGLIRIVVVGLLVSAALFFFWHLEVVGLLQVVIAFFATFKLPGMMRQQAERQGIALTNKRVISFQIPDAVNLDLSLGTKPFILRQLAISSISKIELSPNTVNSDLTLKNEGKPMLLPCLWEAETVRAKIQDLQDVSH